MFWIGSRWVSLSEVHWIFEMLKDVGPSALNTLLKKGWTEQETEMFWVWAVENYESHNRN